MGGAGVARLVATVFLAGAFLATATGFVFDCLVFFGETDDFAFTVFAALAAFTPVRAVALGVFRAVFAALRDALPVDFFAVLRAAPARPAAFFAPDRDPPALPLRGAGFRPVARAAFRLAIADILSVTLTVADK